MNDTPISNPYGNDAATADFMPVPKWRRELRLLRRDGLRKYVRLALALRRFHRSVARMEKIDGYDD